MLFWNNRGNVLDIMHAIPNKYLFISIFNILVLQGQRSIGNIVLQNAFDYLERFYVRKGIKL